MLEMAFGLVVNLKLAYKEPHPGLDLALNGVLGSDMGTGLVLAMDLDWDLRLALYKIQLESDPHQSLILDLVQASVLSSYLDLERAPGIRNCY